MTNRNYAVNRYYAANRTPITSLPDTFYWVNSSRSSPKITKNLTENNLDYWVTNSYSCPVLNPFLYVIQPYSSTFIANATSSVNVSSAYSVTSTFNANGNSDVSFVSGSGILPLSGLSWFAGPSNNPSFQAGMDNFNPSTTTGTPDPSAPIISRITTKASPGGCVWVAGHQFDDQTSLVVYSEVNGTTSLTTAQTLTRNNNMMLCRISTSAIPNSFMLGWLSHPTYGYSEPYPINGPEIFTLHSSFYGKGSIGNSSYIAARVGDDIRIGGINLSSKQSPEKCWLYLEPLYGGTGTWLPCNTVDEGHAIATITAASTGTYNVWTHTGRGGQWGWNKCRIGQVAIETSTYGVGPGVWVSDKNIGAPSGTNDDAAFSAALTSIGTWNTGYISFQAGTYSFSTQKSLQTGFAGIAHLKGAGINSTTIQFAAGTNISGVLFTANNSAWIEDMTLDFSNGVGSFSGDGPIGGFSRMKNVRISTGTRNKCCIYNEGGGYTSPNMIDGCEFSGGLDGYTVIGSSGWIKNSTITCRNLVEGAIFSVFGKQNQAYDNVTVQDFSSSDTGRGRFCIRGYDNRGASFCNCSTVSLKVGGSDQNKGEQILFDGGSVYHEYVASGGTTSTVEFDPVVMINGIILQEVTNASSTNATSTAPTLNFGSAGTNNRYTYIQIVSGTNAIPGNYLITSYNSGTVVLSGGPIGSTATISNIVARGFKYEHQLFNGVLESSNSTTTTPQIKFTDALSIRNNLSSTNANSGSPLITDDILPFTSGDSGKSLWITGGTNWTVTEVTINSVSSGTAYVNSSVGSTATVSLGSGRVGFASSDVNQIIYTTGSSWLGKTRKITSVSTGTATVSGSIGSTSSIIGGTGYKFSRRSTGSGGLLTVKGGKGVSQYGNILDTYANANGDRVVFSLDRVFRIPLDSTSYFKISSGTMDIACYNNNLSGNGGQATLAMGTTGASSGIESFSPNGGFYVWGGSISGVRQALIDWSIGNISGQTAGGVGPSMSVWNYFGDLNVSNCAVGGRLFSGGSTEYKSEVELGLSVWSGINFSSINAADFWLSGWTNKNFYCFNNITISGNGTTAFYGTQSGGTVYSNNCSVSLGNGTFTGSRIITSGSSLTLSQYNPSSGQYIGFQS